MKKYLALFTLILVIAIPFCSWAQTDSFDLSAFAGKRIGIQTGCKILDQVDEFIDNPQMYFFSTVPDGITALREGKIDGFIGDEPVLRYSASQIEGMQIGIVEADSNDVAWACSKDGKMQPLADEMDEFIISQRKSGKLEEMKNRWFDAPDSQSMEDYSLLPGPRGTLRIASDTTYPPFEYLKDGMIVGFDIELFGEFCKKYGYRPQVDTCDFSGIITGVISGKYDVAVTALAITEDRKDSVRFIEPMCRSSIVLAYMDKATASQKSSIIESFRKTFIVEDRWKEFASGALVTLEITVFSILIGTILGFAAFLICRRNNKIVNAINSVIRWIIHGMPIVVLLMILYYIVFGSSDLSGIVISIIGFSLLFACFMIDALEGGERAVDPGQALAARAMGYGEMQAFFKIILPQAAMHIWPSYIEEISSHIKATSVVGFIAVVDITKIGDIIRGRTYDAFFPLIAVAIMYFVMAGILRMIAKAIEKKTNPFNRTEAQILGDIKTE